MARITLELSRTQLFHMETLVSRRITELNDFALSHPHMKSISDEQLAHYNGIHTQLLNAIAEGTPTY